MVQMHYAHTIGGVGLFSGCYTDVMARAPSWLGSAMASLALAACTDTTTSPEPWRTGTRFGAASAITRTTDATVLPDGDMIVVGSTNGAVSPDGRVGSIDALILRAGPDGALRWARQLGGPGPLGGAVVKAWSVAAGPSDDLLVAGLVNGASSIEGQTVVATYTGFVASFARDDGSLRWLSLLGDTSGPTELMGVSVLGDGTIVAGGYSASTSLAGADSLGAGDVVIAWYSPEGERLSVRRYGTADEEFPTAFAARDERIHFARHVVDASLGNALSVEIVALDAAGEVLSVAALAEPAKTSVVALASLSSGPCAALLLRTFSDSAGAGSDFGIRCFDAGLAPIGGARHGLPGVEADAADLDCDASGRCVLVGTVYGTLVGRTPATNAAAFVATFGSGFALEELTEFGPEPVEELDSTRATSVALASDGPRIVGDTRGRLFGDPIGSVDGIIAW